MCGIAFVINYGTTPITPEFLRDLFVDLSNRGKDASGIYFERKEKGKNIRKVFKAPLPSEKLWKRLMESTIGYADDTFAEYRLNGDEKLIMLHCRLKTHGTQYENKNNMPIYSQNYVLIHNGIVEKSGKVKGYKYSAEVDSEEILASIEKYGIKKGISKINGSMSIALRQWKSPYLYIFRNTNPMSLCYLKNYELLIGCSDADYIPLPKEEMSSSLFNPSLTMYDTPSDYLFRISLKKKEVKCLGEIKDALTEYIDKDTVLIGDDEIAADKVTKEEDEQDRVEKVIAKQEEIIAKTATANAPDDFDVSDPFAVYGE